MKITSRTLAPDVQNFFVGYDSGFAVLRRTCRHWPGLRHLIRAKNTLQYDNLLKIYMTILLDDSEPQGTEVPWAMFNRQLSAGPVTYHVCGSAPHDVVSMKVGDKFPTDQLGLFLSNHNQGNDSLIVANEIRILRWCNSRAVPTLTTHTEARSSGTFLCYKRMD